MSVQGENKTIFVLSLILDLTTRGWKKKNYFTNSFFFHKGICFSCLKQCERNVFVRKCVETRTFFFRRKFFFQCETQLKKQFFFKCNTHFDHKRLKSSITHVLKKINSIFVPSKGVNKSKDRSSCELIFHWARHTKKK